MKARLIGAIAALALPFPALASGVVDNVNGIALDANGKIVRFAALIVDDEGKVEKLLPGRYQEPEYKPKKPKRGQPWPERPTGPSFKLDGGGRTLIPGLIDGHGHVMGLWPVARDAGPFRHALAGPRRRRRFAPMSRRTPASNG